MRGLSVLALTVSGICDVVLSAILAVPILMHVVLTHDASHLSKDQIGLAFIRDYPGTYAALFTIGVACSILGGFIAASIGKERPITNGVLASWLNIALKIRAIIFVTGGTSLGFHLGLIAIQPVFYLVGATLRTRIFRPRVAVA